MHPEQNQERLACRFAQCIQASVSVRNIVMYGLFPHQFLRQLLRACGSIANHAPASRRRASPSCPANWTITMAGTNVVLTIALSVAAIAAKLCWVVHQGGKTMAAASALSGSRSASAAITSQLANSKPIGPNQFCHRICTMFPIQPLQDDRANQISSRKWEVVFW